MPYVLTSVPIRRRLPAAVALFRGRRGMGDSSGDFSSVISQSDINNMLTSSPSYPVLETPDLAPTPDLNLIGTSPLSVGSSPGSSSSFLSSLFSAAPSLASAGSSIANIVSGAPSVVAPPGVTSAQWTAMTAAQQQAYLTAANSASSSWFAKSSLISGVSNSTVLIGSVVGVFGLALVSKMMRRK